ncbi:MAG: GtrA family protein [Candidatus Pacearchaeota archaeon]|nr:GtrA family protein [Candidatus Pacearchaeota archaeon]
MLSIILPTKNEALNVERLFKCLSRLKRKLKSFEIIVADSDSGDDTLGVAKNAARKYRLKLKTLNVGGKDLSNAVVAALKHTKGSIICVMDADLQHPPEMIPSMLYAMARNNADVVVASRFVKGSRMRFGFQRIIVSRIYRFLTYLLVPRVSFIKDPAAGFFIFRKKIIRNVKIEPIGFKILLEVLAKAKYKKVIEVPFTFRKRKEGMSKLNLRQSILAFRHLLKISRAHKEHKKFLKFCIVGASGIVVNEGLLWLLTEFAGFFYLVSSIFAIEASILSNFILNDIWTFKRERKGKFVGRLFKFNISRAFALILNFGILWLLTILGLHYLISNLVGITIATIFTYLSSLWWVWK